MFVATEYQDTSLLRLVCNTRALPPSLAWHDPMSKILLFSDGSARHSNVPPARLTYWAVVQCVDFATADDAPRWVVRSPAARVSSFRFLGQRATPVSQTVPRAELAALVCVLKILREHPSLQVELLHTDSAYVVQAWRQCTAGSGNAMADQDLLGQLWPCPCHQVHKVKAYHEALAALPTAPARLQLFTAGNQAANAAARAAKAVELPLVQEASDAFAAHYLEQQAYMELCADYLVSLSCVFFAFRRLRSKLGGYRRRPATRVMFRGRISLTAFGWVRRRTRRPSTRTQVWLGNCMVQPEEMTLWTDYSVGQHASSGRNRAQWTDRTLYSLDRNPRACGRDLSCW